MVFSETLFNFSLNGDFLAFRAFTALTAQYRESLSFYRMSPWLTRPGRSRKSPSRWSYSPSTTRYSRCPRHLQVRRLSCSLLRPGRQSHRSRSCCPGPSPHRSGQKFRNVFGSSSLVNVLMTEVTSLYLPCGRTTLLSVFHIRLFA